MGLDCILSRLEAVRPGVGPEWGGGGIYSLKYHKASLFYTIAFEARSVLVRGDCSESTYDYSLVGPAPRSGGDTYNSVAAVDGEVFFGGWSHAPARLIRRGDFKSEVSFENKYSHLHSIDVHTGRVRLLWKEGAGHSKYWACEVSEVLYNPIRDSLIIARGDGHFNCGIFEVPRQGGRASRLSDSRVLKGEVFMDSACFSHHQGWGGMPGLTCVDLSSGKEFYRVSLNPRKSSIDGGGIRHYRSGSVFQIHTRVYIAHKGGLSVFDPQGWEAPAFYRLMDFGENVYGPLRSNALYIGGGALVAFNIPTSSTVRKTDELPTKVQEYSRYSPCQSLLVYITPSEARVVGLLGGRVTSMESIGSYIAIAWATQPNLERYDATEIDASIRGILLVSQDLVTSQKPPPLETIVKTEWVGDNTFGGIPLHGYKEIRVRGEGSLVEATFYRLGDDASSVERETITIDRGWEDISHLAGGIVSMRIAKQPKNNRLLISAL